MRKMQRRGWLGFFVLLVPLAWAGNWAVGQVRSMRDTSEVAKMTERVRTVCVGRYLVDVPAGAAVNLAGGMLDGFQIATVQESEAAFRKRIAARETEIEAHRDDTYGDYEGGMVAARELRVPGMVGRTLIYGHSRGYLMEGDRRVYFELVSIEAHAHTKGFSLSLWAHSTEETSARQAEAFLARLQLRGEDEVPTGPGFCIWHAIFVEPLPAHSSEYMVMHGGFPDHPDLAFSLFSLAGGSPGPGILARNAHVDATSSADELLRVSKLRAHNRKINGVEGEELLERFREYNLATTYGFNWEDQGVEDDLLRPYLSLELQGGISHRPGGKPVDTSLHEDAVLALWDSIASSIRLRKNSPPPQPAPRPNSPTQGAGQLAEH